LRLQSGDFEVLLTEMKLKFWIFLTGCLTLAARADDPPPFTEWWTFKPAGKCSESSPGVARDGTIYFAGFEGWLWALTPEGKLKWKFKAGREIKSSPAVAVDGTIYFGSRDRFFYAVSPAGRLKWKFAAGGWLDSSPAIAADGTVYFGSWDGNFYALDPAGNVRWKFPTTEVIDSSPAIDTDGTVYFGSHDKNIYALTPDGKLKWEFTTGGAVVASPALGVDGGIFIPSTDGNLYALNSNGTERWRRRTGGFKSESPVLDESGNIYLAAAGQQFSISPAGKVRWQISAPQNAGACSMVTANKNVLVPAPWQFGLATTDEKPRWLGQGGPNSITPPNLSPLGVFLFADWEHLYVFRSSTNAAPAAKNCWAVWRANPQHTGRVQK
jgi:outer membrane protein assembly factor BamB